jgi:hypothetical protein
MNIGVSDKVLKDWLQGKEYISVADEGEGLATDHGLIVAGTVVAHCFFAMQQNHVVARLVVDLFGKRVKIGVHSVLQL